jgi:hypothetical protein
VPEAQAVPEPQAVLEATVEEEAPLAVANPVLEPLEDDQPSPAAPPSQDLDPQDLDPQDLDPQEPQPGPAEATEPPQATPQPPIELGLTPAAGPGFQGDVQL